MDSKGNQLVKKILLKFWVVLGLYGLPIGSATGRAARLPASRLLGSRLARAVFIARSIPSVPS